MVAPLTACASKVSLGMNSNDEDHQGVPSEIVRLIQSAPAGSFSHGP
jgi:hypothetical protein